MLKRLTLFLGIISSFGFSANCQTYVQGSVSGTLYSKPIPFAHLTALPSGKDYLSDGKGNFMIKESGRIETLIVKVPLHRKLEYKVQSDSSYGVNLRLIQNSIIPLKGSTNSLLQSKLEESFRNTKSLDPHKKGRYSIDLYNKFHLGVENLEQTKNLINRMGRIGKFRLPDFSLPHHLFLIESFSKKQFLNTKNQKEQIEAAKVTGIGDASLFSLNSLEVPMGMFQDYVRILGKDYPNPIAGNPFKRYFFSQSDTAIINGDSLVLLYFHPLPGKKVGKLKGFLWWNSSKKRIEKMIVSPAIEGNLRLEYVEHYEFLNEALFPKEIRTRFFISKLGVIRNIVGSLRTYYSEPGDQVSSRKRDYSEVVLNLPDSLQENASHWPDYRMEEFTEEDQATLDFYDSIGQIESLEGLVGFGERVYYGKLPYKKVDFDLNRILNFNFYEDIRVGLGLHTNHKFSRAMKFGGFMGYGFGDQQIKFGGDVSFFPTHKPQFEIRILAEHDLRESGNTSFEKEKRMFSSERLRAYQLQIFEMVDRLNIGIGGRTAKYLQTWVSLERSRENPQYNYSFQGTNAGPFDYSELGLQFRLGLGEQYIQSVWDRISIKKPSPVVCTKLTFGGEWMGGSFNYFKWESKVEYVKKFLGYGKSSFKLIYNFTPNDLPYGKLFNGRGGYRDFSIVIHNAFETMRYNEFISDQMFAIFYSHNFGPISIGFLKHFPTVEMIHNIGFGSLGNAASHSGITFNTMEKGYFESGAYINDILVIKNLGLKSGFGAGMFYRYGPYAFSDPIDNLVIKLALNFGV